MTHWPTSLGDITYRLFLLRRLTLTCALIFWSSLSVAHWLHGDLPHSNIMHAILLLVLAGLLVPALLTVLFPAGWVDTLAMTLSGSVAVLFWPLALNIISHPQPVMAVGFASLVVLGLIFLTCVFMRLICAAHGKWSMGQLTTKSEVTLPVSADDVIRAEFTRPNSEGRRNRTGPENSDGLFPVYYTFIFPDPQNFTIPAAVQNLPPDAQPDAYARVIEDGPHHQVTQYLICEHGTGMTTGGSLIAHQAVEPIDDVSCIYRCEEVHDVWDVVTWVAAWLNDQSRDYLADLSDTLQGRKTSAVRGLPQVTPMTLLAYYFTKWGLAEPNAGHHPD